jgi:hypothetical protein
MSEKKTAVKKTTICPTLLAAPLAGQCMVEKRKPSPFDEAHKGVQSKLLELDVMIGRLEDKVQPVFMKGPEEKQVSFSEQGTVEGYSPAVNSLWVLSTAVDAQITRLSNIIDGIEL